MGIVKCISMLFVLVTHNSSSVTFAAIKITTYTRQTENDGFKCSADTRLFEVKKVISCKLCANECSRYDSCIGVFCNRNTNECIGCKVGYNGTLLEGWNGSRYYQKDGTDLETAHYGMTCAYAADCSFPHTFCLQNTCDCVAGYRREPRNKTCVLNCGSFGTTYIAYPMMLLFSTEEQFDISLEECKAYCSISATCRGFSYCSSCTRCGPTSITPYTNPNDFKPYEPTHYFSRNCADINL